MEAIKRLVETRDLKLNRLAQIAQGRVVPAHFRYSRDVDMVLFLLVPPETETVAHYIDDHVALLYEPGSREVVGVQVEAFEFSFVREHGGVRKVWQLSDACKELSDFGDLLIKVEDWEPVVAKEVVMVADSILGGRVLEEAPLPA